MYKDEGFLKIHYSWQVHIWFAWQRKRFACLRLPILATHNFKAIISRCHMVDLYSTPIWHESYNIENYTLTIWHIIGKFNFTRWPCYTHDLTDAHISIFLNWTIMTGLIGNEDINKNHYSKAVKHHWIFCMTKKDILVRREE